MGKDFVGDLGVVPTNSGTDIDVLRQSRDHGRSRHIDRKYHFIRHKVKEGHFIVKWVSSEKNPADPFRKGLSRAKHVQHARSIGLKDDVSFNS